MGLYINIGNSGFTSSRKSEYVDKSGLISVVNSTINTRQRFTCVTRCRRFGKSMAAEMLTAYYDESCDSRSLFADLEIAKDPSFEEHLNKYPVIYIDMSSFITRYRGQNDIVQNIDRKIMDDVLEMYPDVQRKDDDCLFDVLSRIVIYGGGRQFIVIIDEWDAICREFASESKVMLKYVDWLRMMFKDERGGRVFAAVYMTGILPIKKYKTQSALNNFREYSMIKPGRMAKYFGFTCEEVKALAAKYGMDYDELARWYDGYQIGDELSMFNPNSVMQALIDGRCSSYWASTGAYDAISGYINMNYEGLRDDIIQMLAGGRCPVNPTGFSNDLHEVHTRDDVMTVLIHLGYLSFDWDEQECFIPNKEVAGEVENAVRTTDWTPVVKALAQSKRLLQSALALDSEAVARGVEVVHDDETSILSYNNENSLACVLSLAFYYAKNEYFVKREMPLGKGFADLVLIPRKHIDKPAMVIELKYNHDAETAIDQIHRRHYADELAAYSGRVLLVGINYDKPSKQHTCKIEEWEK